MGQIFCLEHRDIKAVLDHNELFQTDEFGMVSCFKSVQQSGTFVPENNKNVHECGTEVGTLCTDSKVGEKKEITENKEDTSDSLAYTHVEEKREEKKRIEKRRTPLTPLWRGDSVDKLTRHELTRPCGTVRIFP